MTEANSVLDAYHLGEALKPSARKLGERGGLRAVTVLADRLKQYLSSPEDDKYSNFWRSAIEEHEQNHGDDARSVLVDTVRDVTLGATALAGDDALTAARVLLDSSYPTLVRIGIYVCGEHYGSVGGVFWDLAKADWFIDTTYWHEVYWFIKKAFAKFSVSERERFLALVDGANGDWSNEARGAEWDDMHHRDLLHPAVGQGDKVVDEKYRVLVERWGDVREHVDFHSYTTGGWFGDQSPISSDALVKMTDKELAEYLRTFVPISRLQDGETSYRGLASAISAAVRSSADGFRSRFKLFENVARAYQHGLLRGLTERVGNDKREIEWPAVLTLLHSIVSSPEVAKDLQGVNRSSWEPNIYWVLGDVADLLRTASEPGHRFPIDLFAPCVEILRKLLKILPPSEAVEEDDAVSRAINSPRGKAIETFIRLSLSVRRDDAEGQLADQEIWRLVGPTFDAELASSESGRNADFSALAGMYCANLHFINAQWTENNFDRIFSLSNDLAWKCAAEGLAYQRYLYPWLYRKLIQGGHLHRMINSLGLPDKVPDKALQFLGLAYLEGQEDLVGTGPLGQIVSALDVDKLSRLCRFFWSLRADPPARRDRVLKFWLVIAQRLREKPSTEPRLQASLGLLTVFIDELTSDLANALADAAPHFQVRHNGNVLAESLRRLVSRYPKEVATVFKAAMTGFLPDYRTEDVIGCVLGLAEAGEIEEAEGICNAYAEKGSSLLKKTYEQLRATRRGQPDGE